MRGIRLWMLGCAMAACSTSSPVSDPSDLDQDGIQDDPCIAPASEAAGDLDRDGIANADDPCPAKGARDGEPDTDGDGIPDACDPFPTVAGDHHRCTMLFSDPALDDALWHAPAGSAGFAYKLFQSGPELRADSPPAVSMATANIEAAGTTAYEVGLIITGESTVPNDFTLYLRADAASPDTNVGCVFDALPNQGPFPLADWRLAIVQGSTVLSEQHKIVANGSVIATMRAVIEPDGTGANVRCDVSGTVVWGSEQLSPLQLGPVTAEARLRAGTFGFATSNSSASVRTLSIYDRDDAPGL